MSRHGPPRRAATAPRGPAPPPRYALPRGIARLQADGLALHVAKLAQALPEGIEAALGVRVKRRVSRSEHADDGDVPRRLGLRGAWRHKEATDERDETPDR